MIWSLPNPWKIIVLAAFAATCIASALLIARDVNATWVCSVCGNEWVLIDGTPLDNQMNYCPKCGARMDGGTKANG